MIHLILPLQGQISPIILHFQQIPIFELRIDLKRTFLFYFFSHTNQSI